MKSHRWLMIFSLLFIICSTIAQEIEHGMSKSEVIDLLGQPRGRIQYGTNVSLVYEIGTIEFAGGKVTHSRLATVQDTEARTIVAPGARAVSRPAAGVNDAAQSILMVQVGQSRGSAFVAAMNNRRYLVTNAHLITRGKDIEFRQLDGRTISDRFYTVQFAKGRDLVRIELPHPENVTPLPMAEGSPVIGQRIVAFGDSLGEQAVAVSWGTVLSIGENKFEVDAALVPGNSGGPILNAQGEVLGVATYVTRRTPSWVTDGTRFAGARRWALSLDNVLWSPHSKQEVLTYIRHIEDLHTFYDDYIELVGIIAGRRQPPRTDDFRAFARNKRRPEERIRYTNTSYGLGVTRIAESFANWADATGDSKWGAFMNANEEAMRNLDIVIRQSRQFRFPSQEMESEQQLVLDRLIQARDFHETVLRDRR